MALFLSKNNHGHFTVEEFYGAQQKHKLKKNPDGREKINKEHDQYFIRMLGKQLQKLIVDGKFEGKTEEGGSGEQVFHINRGYYKKYEQTAKMQGQVFNIVKKINRGLQISKPKL